MHITDYIQATKHVLEQNSDTSKMLNSLQKYLGKRGLMKAYPSILRGLIAHMEREQKMNTPVLKIAREQDAKVYKEEVDVALEKFDASNGHKTVIDQTLIGGFVIENAHLKIDTSHKQQLLKSYHHLLETNN